LQELPRNSIFPKSGYNSMHGVTNLRSALSALATKVCEECRLATEGPAYFSGGEAGSFEICTVGANGPVIRLFWPRPSLRLPDQHSVVELVEAAQGSSEELYTLAHEYGHYLSYKRGKRSPCYESSLLKFNGGQTLTRKERAAILEEESRAWSYGVSTLKCLGFRKSKLGRRMKKRALAIYRIKLGMQLRRPSPRRKNTRSFANPSEARGYSGAH
jgi:hypothetical protein